MAAYILNFRETLFQRKTTNMDNPKEVKNPTSSLRLKAVTEKTALIENQSAKNKPRFLKVGKFFDDIMIKF